MILRWEKGIYLLNHVFTCDITTINMHEPGHLTNISTFDHRSKVCAMIISQSSVFALIFFNYLPEKEKNSFYHCDKPISDENVTCPNQKLLVRGNRQVITAMIDKVCHQYGGSMFKSARGTKKDMVRLCLNTWTLAALVASIHKTEPPGDEY